MTTIYKKGDKFIPRKPKDVTQAPAWRREMDKYDGKELTVDIVDSFGYIQAEGDYYVFHPDCCEKVGKTNQIPEVGKMVESAHLINEATKPEKEFIVTFDASEQVSEDRWAVINPTLKVKPETTIAEIESFYRKWRKLGAMEVKIIELSK